MSDLPKIDIMSVFVESRAILERLLTNRLRDRQAAQDLTQDLYFKLARVADEFPSKDDARRYLFRMAVNAALDHRRVEGRRSELLAGIVELFDANQATPEEVLGADEEVARIEAALKDLPPKCRDVLFMSRMEGMTHAEIAEKLGVSRSLVEKYAVRALLHCRARLKEGD
jgi:RNA polymerase sigma factor (sigma-70 family)